MNKKHVILSLCFLFVLSFFSQQLMGQKKMEVSKADKAKIIELLKDVPKDKYLLQFNQGKEKYGRLKVSMSDLKRVKAGDLQRYKFGQNQPIILVDIMFWFNGGNAELDKILEARKAGQLKAILRKYNK